MQTVLIADDEENIREGIKLIIDWEALGFEIAGDASNGEEALFAITKLNPSLVVMDMQMPKLHGIDVIKKAREQGYNGYFIILSGYSDFTYAQEAIRNNVTNYITKPVDEDELWETVKRIGDEIRNSEKEGGLLGKMKNKARSVVLQELLLGNYFDATNKEPSIRHEQLETLDSMKLLFTQYQVIIHETYHTGRDVKKPDYQLTELLPTFLDESGYESVFVDGHDCILLMGKASISRFEDFICHYEKSPIESDSPLDSVFIAIGESVLEPEKISLSFEHAKNLAKRRFFCEEGEHFVRAGEYKRDNPADDTNSNCNNTKLPNKEYQNDIAEKILELVISGNRKGIIDKLEVLSNELRNSSMASTDICLFVTEIMLQLKDRLTKQYPMLSDVFDSHAGIIEFIEGRFYLYEIRQYVMDVLEKAMDLIHVRSGPDNIIEDIISYTDRYYAQQLTLEDLAALFGYNSGYLGRLFTKTTGTGYNYYLNECRIAKAKEFLAEGKYKVYEVAQLVGYNDVDYFGKKFRKHAGMTPAEFRKQSTGKD